MWGNIYLITDKPIYVQWINAFELPCIYKIMTKSDTVLIVHSWGSSAYALAANGRCGHPLVPCADCSFERTQCCKLLHGGFNRTYRTWWQQATNLIPVPSNLYGNSMKELLGRLDWLLHNFIGNAQIKTCFSGYFRRLGTTTKLWYSQSSCR